MRTTGNGVNLHVLSGPCNELAYLKGKGMLGIQNIVKMPKEFLSPPSPVDTVICDMQNRAADILRIQDGKYTQPYITSRIMEGTDGNGSSYRKKKRKMHNARTLWKEVKDNDYVSDDKRFEIRDILSEYLGDNFATKKVKGL